MCCFNRFLTGIWYLNFTLRPLVPNLKRFRCLTTFCVAAWSIALNLIFGSNLCFYFSILISQFFFFTMILLVRSDINIGPEGHVHFILDSPFLQLVKFVSFCHPPMRCNLMISYLRTPPTNFLRPLPLIPTHLPITCGKHL